jgi:hypothetical protein
VRISSLGNCPHPLHGSTRISPKDSFRQSRNRLVRALDSFDDDGARCTAEDLLFRETMIIRDQDLLNPNAPPAKSEPILPKMLFDRDGDAANSGTGFGKPAKDLSINFVPVPYPDYRPAIIEMKPDEQQLWRVVNASGITYLNLEVLFGHTPQPLGLVAMDGVPLNENGLPADFVDWQTHLGVPPGARVEFIVKGPPAGVSALLVTKTVDTGPSGENDPNRAIATIAASKDAAEPSSELATSPGPLPPSQRPWLGSVLPARTRRLYFSEKLLDPNDPNSATEFYVTLDGQTPAQFDPKSGIPSDSMTRESTNLHFHGLTTN